MTLEVVRTALAVVGAVVLLGLVLVFVLGLARRGPMARVTARQEAEIRTEVDELARSRGWRVEHADEVADRAYDQRLAAERAHPVGCVHAVDGGRDGFVAETWAAGVRNLGSPVRMPAHQHIVRFRSPGTPRFLVRGMPSRHELRHFPREFKDQSGFVSFHTSMLVGGDFAAVQDRLGPFIEAIDASRVWVIGIDGELMLLSGSQPGAVELERRIGLGRVIVEALSTPATEQ